MPGYGTAAANADVQLTSQFRLELDGIQVMAFEEVEIGDSEWSEITNRTGIDGLVTQTSSALKKPIDITIKKHERVGGAADIDSIIAWHQGGSGDRRNGAIIYLDRAGAVIRRLNFGNAWIKKYTFPPLNANEESGKAVHSFVLSVPEISVG